MTPFVTMSLSVHSICSQYSMGTFCQACCPGGMKGSVLMVYVLRMLPMVSKELGKACFNTIMSWTSAVVQGNSPWATVSWGRAEAMYKYGLNGGVTLVERCFCT